MRRFVALVLPLAPITFFAFSALAQQNNGPIASPAYPAQSQAYPSQTSGTSNLPKTGQGTVVHPAAPAPTQKADREAQLQLQYQGLSAFNDATVQQKLLLTSGQVQKFHIYNNQQTMRWHEVLRFSGNDLKRAKAGYDSLVAQNNILIKSVLSAQQFKLWSEMIGAPQQFEPHWVQN